MTSSCSSHRLGVAAGWPSFAGPLPSCFLFFGAGNRGAAVRHPPGFAAPRWGRLLPRALGVSPAAFVPRKTVTGSALHGVTKGVGDRRAELFRGEELARPKHTPSSLSPVGIYPVLDQSGRCQLWCCSICAFSVLLGGLPGGLLLAPWGPPRALKGQGGDSGEAKK